MLSSRLIHMIEDHWASITGQVIREIHDDPWLEHVGRLPADELRDRARDVLEHLGHWLSMSDREELARRFQRLGAERRKEGVPLAETALCYFLMKNRMIEFVREHEMAETPVAIYAEEELEHCIGRFFDNAVYNIVAGYERAAPTSRAAQASR